MNMTGKFVVLQFKVGIHRVKGTPQLQKRDIGADHQTLYVLRDDTPIEMKTAAEKGQFILCQEHSVLFNDGKGYSIVAMEAIETIESGATSFREGAKGFWYPEAKSARGIPLHFVVHHRSDKPVNPGNWNFEIVGTAKPMRGEIPCIVVRLTSEVISERALRRRERKGDGAQAQASRTA